MSVLSPFIPTRDYHIVGNFRWGKKIAFSDRAVQGKFSAVKFSPFPLGAKM